MTMPPTDDELIAIRRHLHAHPELSGEEEETARYIEERLRGFGVQDIKRVSQTGVVAIIEGDRPGPTLGYRADIDALPIVEENGCDYKSQNPGVMHACGHDVHTTVGLGVARALAGRREDIDGRIKLIFQPAEEATPEDEPVGAERMVVDGVLQEPTVDAMYALHCMPSMDVGRIGHTGGPVWAGSELVDIVVRGEKAHGAYPHEGIDAISVACQLVVSLQQIASRRIDGRDACVFTVGTIEGGDNYNILADRVMMQGILRGLSTEVMDRARGLIQEQAPALAEAMGAQAAVTITPGARPVINDRRLEDQAVAIIEETQGPEAVTRWKPQLGAEDFSAFSRRVPGCYLFLGIRNEDKEITSALHTPTFDVDEACLGVGVEAMVEVLLRTGQQGPSVTP